MHVHTRLDGYLEYVFQIYHIGLKNSSHCQRFFEQSLAYNNTYAWAEMDIIMIHINKIQFADQDALVGDWRIS